MTMEVPYRDPRIAPINGDVLRPRLGGRERHVICTYGRDEVTYRSIGSGRNARNVCSMQTWRQWCARENVDAVQMGDAIP